MAPETADLDAVAAAYLQKSGATTGEKLYEKLRTKFPGLTEDDFAGLVERLAAQDQVDLYERPAGSFTAFLGGWERNWWFFLSIILCASAALTVYIVPADSPFLIIRWVLGLLFVIFLPGFVAVQALYPTGQPRGIDRLALSVGVSLVLDIFAGLVINFASWGLTLVPILCVLTALTICLALLGLARQFRALRASTRLRS